MAGMTLSRLSDEQLMGVWFRANNGMYSFGINSAHSDRCVRIKSRIDHEQFLRAIRSMRNDYTNS